MSDAPTLTSETGSIADDGASSTEALALVLAWYAPEPGRAGEVTIIPPVAGAAFALGRGPQSSGDSHRRLDFARQRAQLFEPCAPLGSGRISRTQMVIQPQGARSLSLRNVGRCPLWHNGVRVEQATVVPGDTLRLGQEAVLLCVRRRASGGASRIAPTMPFGLADAHGLVGESPAVWELRKQIQFAGAQTDHVLITGDSGTGKELVARAVHASSTRADRPLVARNAATFPDGLVDAELFGHARNYPNAGMAERPGLLGQAPGGSLFLDEISELPAELQTHLLRVLDRGEYQRLGDSAPRVADVRFIAATNRPEGLRPDLAARFKLRIPVPTLGQRAEDIPLLAANRLRTLARSDATIAERVLSREPDREGEVQLTTAFVDALLRHVYLTNVRELDAVLWESLQRGESGLEWPPARKAPQSQPAAPSAAVDPKALTRHVLEAALEQQGGSLERTWRELGLSSRHALARLMSKRGVRRPERS
jgi:two-component system nitrogen regulation response regulator GlnG/two-component system response regulator HydG